MSDSRVERSVTIIPHASTAAAPPAREAIARQLGDANISVRLRAGADPVPVATVLAMNDAQLRELGVDPGDLWRLLGDVDVARSGGGVVDLAPGSRLAERYLVRDGIDANYESATVATSAGAAQLAEAMAVRGRTDGTRPNWFMRALEAIAEFFVELFTSNNYITSAERDENLGRLMVREHPETLRAILAEDGGEQRLRQRLLAQRPQGTSPSDWNGAVQQMLQGVRRELRSAPDLPDAEFSTTSVLVRDRLTAMYFENDNATSRTNLAAVAANLARSGLPDDAQIAFLQSWATAGRPRETMLELQQLVGALDAQSPMVRREIAARLEERPEAMETLSVLVRSEGFAAAGLTDVDRVALLRQWAADPARAASLARAAGILASPAGAALAAPVRAAVLRALDASATQDRTLNRFEQLLGTVGFRGADQATQLRAVERAFQAATTDEAFIALLVPLRVDHTGDVAGLNRIIREGGTLAAGASGREVLVVNRYLRALGYDELLGPDQSSTFTSGARGMSTAVEQFQRAAGLLEGNPPAATAGVVDQATLGEIYRQLGALSLEPTAFRFTTTLSLDRPVHEVNGRAVARNDGTWRATQRWSPALITEYREFAQAYVSARIPRAPGGQERDPLWAERVDCADLSYEALIQFARQRGLPVHFESSGVTISNSGPTPIVRNVQSNFGAMHLQHFTQPLAEGALPNPGDIGNMQWNQSHNGHDSRYWHSHNIVNFDPLFREATVIFGSLDDLVKERALTTFNGRGYNLTVHDIPEVHIIDAINDDSNQGRAQTREVQEERVRELLSAHTSGGHTVSDADVDAFIAMIANSGNIARDQPTAVSDDPQAFHSLVDGDPWADPTQSATEVAALNTRFTGASFTAADIDTLVAAGGRRQVLAAAERIVARQNLPADQREAATQALVDGARRAVRFNADRDALADPTLRRQVVRSFNAEFGARITDADVRTVLAEGSDVMARAEAERLLAHRGVPADQRATAAAALVEMANSTRRFRTWDFDMFNRHM